MAELYTGRGGIWVPGEDGKPRIKCKNPIPLSILQMEFNRLYYGRHDVALKHLHTIGSEDALLPKAAAADLAANHPETRHVHEIGPGNFNFAMRFVASAGLDDLVYTGHDFADKTFGFVKDQIEKYGGRIRFNKAPITGFTGEVKDDPLYVILVEVLDDTLTEFFLMHDSQEYMAWKKPQIRADFLFPSRFLHGKLRELQGDAFRGEADKGISDRTYTAEELVGFMEMGRWDEFDNVSHAFLQLFELGQNEFCPTPLEFMHQAHWKSAPESFREFGNAIIRYAREQLRDAAEDQIVSIPLGGLMFLWQLSKRSNVHADVFDYGFEEPVPGLDFHQYNGQITSPVNFGLLKRAAEWLGFNVALEKDSEYIKRNLGADTIRLVYASRPFHAMPKPLLQTLIHAELSESVKRLCHEVECTPDNILGMRAERDEYERFLKTAVEKGMADPDANLSEGTYHLAVDK